MPLLDELAGFVTDLSFHKLPPETIERTKLHVFDSLGALFAGAQTDESKAASDLVDNMHMSAERRGLPVVGFGFSAPLPYALLLTCVATRMTEADDIDLSSCTTPGSVIVPAALCFALYRGVGGKEFLEGVVAGYDLITRLGAAVNGPEILYRGIWPTYLCGAIGAATVGAKILGLTTEQTRNALAISLNLSSGLAPRIKADLSSRWLTLGCAAQNGLHGALAAERGFAGDVAVLDSVFPSVLGLDVNKGILLGDLGKKFLINNVSLKPYCSARQAISPVEAFRWLLKTHQFDPAHIEEVEVVVPRQYSRMIDRAEFPDGRMPSIVSVQYQMALAAFYEDDLYDIQRKRLRDEERVRDFIRKVRVVPSSEFSNDYPERWPGKVAVTIHGETRERLVLAPSGAPDQPMAWKDVEEKLKGITRGVLRPDQVEEMGAALKGLDLKTDMGAFVKGLPRMSF